MILFATCCQYYMRTRSREASFSLQSSSAIRAAPASPPRLPAKVVGKSSNGMQSSAQHPLPSAYKSLITKNIKLAL
jgi:hypothetical protein